jgi:hypothetical protein
VALLSSCILNGRIFFNRVPHFSVQDVSSTDPPARAEKTVSSTTNSFQSLALRKDKSKEANGAGGSAEFDDFDDFDDVVCTTNFITKLETLLLYYQLFRIRLCVKLKLLVLTDLSG